MRTKRRRGKRKERERKRDGKEKIVRRKVKQKGGKSKRSISVSHYQIHLRPLKEAGLQKTKTNATRLWVIIDVFVGQKGKEGLKMKEVRRKRVKFSGSQDTFIRSF